MKAVSLLQKSIFYQAVLIPLVLSSLFAGTVELVDGVSAKGTIKAVTSEHIKFQKDGNTTVAEIPIEKIRLIEINGIKYSFDKGNNEWIQYSGYTQKETLDTFSMADEKKPEKAVDISIRKYTPPFLALDNRKNRTVLDSIYRNNFYELRYRGYNFELCDEVYAIQDISGARIRSDIENPHKSGNWNFITGYCMLGWGLIITGVSAVTETETIGLGIGLLTGSGISFAIGIRRKKEYERWENKYR